MIIVETTSTGAAFTISKVMPYAVAAVLIAWMFAYGQRAKGRGERLAAATTAPNNGESTPPAARHHEPDTESP